MSIVDCQQQITDTQIRIRYNGELEDLEVLDAYTLLSNGEKLTVKDDAIRTIDDAVGSFSEDKFKVIIFPGVTVGAKMHYITKKTTRKSLFPGNYQGQFSFSPSYDIDYFEWNFSHDPGIDIVVQANGIEGGKVQSNNDTNIVYQYTYSNSNVEIPEPNQISARDFSPIIALSSFKTPIDIGAEYEKNAKPKIAVTSKVQALADELTNGIESPKQQAQAIYQWVAKNIRYVAIYIGSGGVVPHEADSIIENRYGDCKDHDALLRSLLAAKGIETSSALINLGGAYSLPSIGLISPLNHVITYIPSWDLYLDSTQDLASFGVLIDAEMDKPVVLTALRKIGRTQNETPESNSTLSVIKMTIHEDGSASGSSSTKYAGPNEIDARNLYSLYIPLTKESIVRNHLSSFNESGDGEFIPSDPHVLDKPFVLMSAFTLDTIVEMSGLSAIKIPVGLSPGEIATFASSQPKINRKFPYICSSQTIVEKYSLSFPRDIKIKEIPRNKKIHDGDYLYISSYSRAGNVVNVERVLKIAHHGMVCSPQEEIKWKGVRDVIKRDLLGQVFFTTGIKNPKN